MSTLELALFVLALAGLYLVLSSLPVFQPRTSLHERLRRFDVDARLRERRPFVTPATRPLLPWAPLDAALRPLLEDLAAPLQHLLLRDGVFGPSVDRQLRVVHAGMTRQAFIARQLLWSTSALALFLAVFASNQQLGAGTLLVSLLAGAVGFLVPWLLLRRDGRARRRRLLAELPHVARLLALGVSALPRDVALGRIGTQSRGPLGQLIGRTHLLAADGTCALLPELARRAELEDLPELVTFVALLKTSDAQGLQLAPSLETLASTLQQRSAARLLATAERGTIKMLFPLALVLTPVIVLVSLVPAILALYALVRGGG